LAPPGVLAAFSLPSHPGNEREALARVAEALAGMALTDDQRDRLKTAVAEATMNAIEHGNDNRPELLVDISVLDEGDRAVVTVTDQGGAPEGVGQTHPDLDLKLAGLQTPRGWGLFLIQEMVDDVRQVTEGGRHTVRLAMNVNRNNPNSAEANPPEVPDVDV